MSAPRTGGPDGTEKVLLCRALHLLQAATLVAELEGCGIPAWRVGGQSMLMGDVPAEVVEVEVWVPAEHLQAAREVLAESRAHLADADGGRSAWTCPACGESNEGGFELCWSCEAPRSADRPD
jgi:hypothetical protein